MLSALLMSVQLAARVARPTRRSLTQAGADAAAAPRRRIAIVEDELMVAWSLESALEQSGHCIAGIFPDAEAALSSLLREPVDLVLMDINLGDGMDGVETARRIRAAWGIPIIFISAYADASTRERISTVVPGALLLSKPLQAADLEAALVSTFSTAN